MVRPGRGTFVDGYTALKAAQHAERDPKKGHHPVSSTEEKPSAQKSAPIAAKHIGRTVMPTKHEIVCYECGFVFHQAGRIQAAVCSKCHAKLSFLDLTIKTEWEDTIRTAGTVTIAPEGTIIGGEIIAGKVLLQGQVKGGVVKAMKSLTLSPGVTYSEEHTQTRDLILQEGAELKLSQPAKLRNADVFGRLEGRLIFEGQLFIRSGGSVYGEIQVQHLVVEEGGGLCAEVKPVE